MPVCVCVCVSVCVINCDARDEMNKYDEKCRLKDCSVNKVGQLRNCLMNKHTHTHTHTHTHGIKKNRWEEVYRINKRIMARHTDRSTNIT